MITCVLCTKLNASRTSTRMLYMKVHPKQTPLAFLSTMYSLVASSPARFYFHKGVAFLCAFVVSENSKMIKARESAPDILEVYSHMCRLKFHP